MWPIILLLSLPFVFTARSPNHDTLFEKGEITLALEERDASLKLQKILEETLRCALRFFPPPVRPL